jgi:hypothetical protein
MKRIGTLNGRNAPSLHVSKDYQEMMQTYKDSRDKSAQQKMQQFSLSNKNWIRLNGLLMPFNVRKRFCYHEHYALSRRIS